MEKEIWVECIDDFSLHSRDLTLGRIYKVKKAPSDNNCYIVQNGSGKEFYHSISKFKPVDKTPIKWNGINSIDRFVQDKRIEIEIQATQSHFTFILKVLIDKSFFASKQYVIQVDKEINKVEDFVKEINTICLKYDIKLELDQPKFKINCDKVYTKEEADKLRESGIDMPEAKN